VPGEHDLPGDDGGKQYLDRFGAEVSDDGKASIIIEVHFSGLNSSAELESPGMIGEEQLAWLKRT
jgi:hypothetical protein